jgi:hypothetical protein
MKGEQKMFKWLKNLLIKDYTKILIHKEYSSPIKYGYELHHKVISYITITRHFSFKERLWYSVTVPNAGFGDRKLLNALTRAMEHESIGMAKYQRIKEDLFNQDLYRKLDPDFKRKVNS